MTACVFPDVHPGQVWRDRDKREYSGNRRVKVVKTSLEDGQAYVYYRQVVGANNTETGRTPFKAKYARFQRAFTLVSAETPEGR